MAIKRAPASINVRLEAALVDPRGVNFTRAHVVAAVAETASDLSSKTLALRIEPKTLGGSNPVLDKSPVFGTGQKLCESVKVQAAIEIGTAFLIVFPGFGKGRRTNAASWQLRSIGVILISLSRWHMPNW